MRQHPQPLAALVLAALAAAAGASPPATTASFQDWLQRVEFSPPTLNLDMSSVDGINDTTFAGGTCTGLLIRSVTMQDFSVGPTLRLTFNISGIDIRCTLLGNATTLSADVALTDSWAGASAAVMPYFGFGKPLPVGVMMADCRTSLQISRLQFSGDSTTVAKFDANKTAVADRLKASVDDLLCTHFSGKVTTMGSELLQNVAMIAAELLNPRPLPPLPRATAPIMDWGAYPPIKLGKAMLADRLARLSSKPLRADPALRFDVTPEFGIRLDALEVVGLHTIPVSSLILTGSNGTIDAGASVGHLSLSVASKFEVSQLQQQMLGLVQSLNLTVSLSDLAIFVQAVAMMSQPTFEEMEVPQLQMPGCLVHCAKSAADPPIGSIGVHEMKANLSDFALRSGVPGGPLAEDLAAVVDTTVGAVLQGYLPSMVAIVNGLSGYLFNSMNDKLWMHLDDPTKYPCEQSGGVEGVVGAAALKGLWGTSICLTLVGLAVGAAAAASARRRSGGAGGGAVAAAAAAEAAGARQPGNEDPEASPPTVAHGEVQVAEEDLCLAKSDVPRALSLFFPFAVVSVMLLFLFADLDLGTSVDVLITAEGDSVTFGSLFTFSLISTITHTWDAKAYAISLLTLLFSGLWPLVKLAFLMLAWLAPPRRIGLKTRGRLLSFLDVWGKYSFLDSWFLVLCMSAFAMKWESGDASMKVRTRPTVAYFAFLLATVLSLLLGNVASYYHRRAEAKRVGASSSGRGGAAESRAVLGQEGHHKATYAGVTALLVFSVLVTVAGAMVVSFEFGMTGLGADLIFQEAHHTDAYSLFSAGMGVSASKPGDFGLVALETVFLLISFAVPVMLLLALLMLWAAPLKAQEQDSLLYACHVLDSWSTLDVFVLTILVGHAEFGQLAGRLIATGNLKTICGLVEGLNMNCMELDLQFRPGFALLLTAGLVALAVPKCVHWLCRRTVRARDARSAKMEKHGSKQEIGSLAGSPHTGVQPGESQRSGVDDI